MNHQDEIDRVVSEHAAEKASAFEAELAAIGERGFMSIVEIRSNTEQLLFEAKSKAHELNQNDAMWQDEFDEKLMAECLRLTKGDKLKAQLLASWAVGS